MRFTVIGVGRSSKGPERDLTERYLKRIPPLARAQGFAGIDLHQLPESRKDIAASRKQDEAAAIAKHIEPGFVIALDERGEQFSSELFAALLKKIRSESPGNLHFILGGPDGLDISLTKKADKIIGLGAMTWPHQLALALLMEQIYRGLTLLSGHPYHRV